MTMRPCPASGANIRQTSLEAGYKRCPLCERDIKKQGFGGHMWGVHGVKTGQKAQLADLQQRLNQEEDRWNKVKALKVNLFHFAGYRVLVIPEPDQEKQS